MHPLAWLVPIKKAFLPSHPHPPSLIQFSETSGQTVSLIFPAWNSSPPSPRTHVVSGQTSSLFLSFLSLTVWAHRTICFVSCPLWSCEVFMSDLYLTASVVITSGAVSYCIHLPTFCSSWWRCWAPLFIRLLHAIHAWLPAYSVLLLSTDTATNRRPVACNLKRDSLGRLFYTWQLASHLFKRPQ